MTQPTVLCSPCGVPGSVTDRGHASRRLSALTADLYWNSPFSPIRWTSADLGILGT